MYEADFRCTGCKIAFKGDGTDLEAATSAMRRSHNEHSRTCDHLEGTVTVRNKETRRVLATLEMDEWLHF